MATSQTPSSGAEIAVLVPVLNRPQNVKPLLDAFEASTRPGCYEMFFICDSDDKDEIAAVRKEKDRCALIIHDSNFAGKINYGVQKTSHPFVFIGADDLEPQPGWLEAAERAMKRGAEVIGVNDLIERKRRWDHATHFLMTRDYALKPTIDGEPGPLWTGYTHWYVDDELIATAKKRGVYVYARDSKVKHLHPMNGGAEDDDTYKKGREQAGWDYYQFRQRIPLWW